MNTKTLKGILLYSLIIIATIAVCFGIMIGLMFIFPDLKLFGYGMISRMHTSSSNTNTISNITCANNYDLTINVDNFNLVVVGTEGNDITYEVNDKCVGATNVFNTSVLQNQTSTSYSITLIEPSGMLFYNKSNIQVSIPQNLKYNLTVKSVNGNISIQNVRNINNLTITTTDGDFSLTNKDSKSINLNSLYITTNKGNFNFKENFDSVTIDKLLTINSNLGNFYFKNLTADIKINSNDIFFEATDIVTKTKGLEINTQNIVFKIYGIIKSSTQNSIITSTASININEITGTTSIKSSYGGISIGTINSQCIIESSDGNVSIKSAKEYIKVKTDFGNITVENYEKSGIFTSTSGNIICTSTSTDFSNITKITTTTGNIEHKTNGVAFDINASGAVSININLKNIGESKTYNISAENSTLNMNITNKKYAKYQVKGNIIQSTSNMAITNSETPIIYPSDYNGSNEASLPLIKINCANITLKSIS